MKHTGNNILQILILRQSPFRSLCMVISFALTIGIPVHGQELNVLKAAITQANTDSLKIDAYSKALKYFKPLNTDSAIYYAQEGLKYATTHKYRFGQGVMISELGIIDQSLGRLDLARERISYGLEIYTEANFLRGMADLNNSLGAIEATRGNYDAAIKCFIKALKIHESYTDDEGLMLCNMNLGALYMQLQDTANAPKYLFLAEKISKKLPVIDATISLYNYLGIYYASQGNLDRALECFKNDVRISDNPKFAASHVESLLYLATFYDDLHDYKNAMECLNEGLEIARKKQLQEVQADLLVEIANIIARKSPQQAMDTLNKAQTIAELINSKTLIARICKQKSTIYEQEGKFREALGEYRKQQGINDSIMSVNKTNEIESIGATYELEKSTARISELEYLSQKNALQRNIIVLISLAVIIILIVVVRLYFKTVGLNRKLVKREEELNDLNHTKDRLFSIIGHDLRWPVARIPMVLEMVEDDAITAEEKKFLLDNLSEHTKATVETLDKLLYWGQSLIKGVNLKQELFHPTKFIEQSIDLRKLAAADKHITITNNVPQDMEVYADPAHFDFVIRNLMGNALKFTPLNGSISIDADTESIKDKVVFSVKDNGIGIEKEKIKTIFEAFSSKDGTANEKGTGIGLMLCKEFIVKNGGDIWVESELNKGTTFYFSVKRKA